MAEEFGKYKLVEKIAQGGMAEVFLATQAGEIGGFEKEIAIKRIFPNLASEESMRNMFLDEARIAANLNHPNIVQVYDLGQVGEYLYIAMEFVDGRDFRTVLEHGYNEGNEIPLNLAVNVVANAAAGLHYAHTRTDSDGEPMRIVHRDMSPQNILISNEGHVKVCDFGIAKAEDRIGMTRAGEIKGKIAYMSPEQVRGTDDLDHRSDIFALGIVLYESTTMRRLFSGESDFDTMREVVEGEIEAPRDVSPGYPADLEKLVLKALCRNPDDRFQTAEEMQLALEEWLVTNGASTSPVHLSRYLKNLFLDKKEEREFSFDDKTQVMDVEDKVKQDSIVIDDDVGEEGEELESEVDDALAAVSQEVSASSFQSGAISGEASTGDGDNDDEGSEQSFEIGRDREPDAPEDDAAAAADGEETVEPESPSQKPSAPARKPASALPAPSLPSPGSLTGEKPVKNDASPVAEPAAGVAEPSDVSDTESAEEPEAARPSSDDKTSAAAKPGPGGPSGPKGPGGPTGPARPPGSAPPPSARRGPPPGARKAPSGGHPAAANGPSPATGSPTGKASGSSDLQPDGPLEVEEEWKPNTGGKAVKLIVGAVGVVVVLGLIFIATMTKDSELIADAERTNIDPDALTIDAVEPLPTVDVPFAASEEGVKWVVNGHIQELSGGNLALLDGKRNEVIAYKEGFAPSVKKVDGAPGMAPEPLEMRPFEVDATGELSIVTEPRDAKIFVDGVMRGTTPTTVKGLSADFEHHVQVVKEGRYGYAGFIRLEPGKEAVIETTLHREDSPRKNYVEVVMKAKPNGLGVSIDGEVVGGTPFIKNFERKRALEVTFDGPDHAPMTRQLHLVDVSTFEYRSKLRDDKRQRGKISVTVDPPGPTLYVGPNGYGEGPAEELEFPEGKVRVVLDTSYDRGETNLAVEPNTVTEYTVSLVDGEVVVR